MAQKIVLSFLLSASVVGLAACATDRVVPQRLASDDPNFTQSYNAELASCQDYDNSLRRMANLSKGVGANYNSHRIIRECMQMNGFSYE